VRHVTRSGMLIAWRTRNVTRETSALTFDDSR
jgi:hypothetical protein